VLTISHRAARRQASRAVRYGVTLLMIVMAVVLTVMVAHEAEHLVSGIRQGLAT
jgi:hypothetical protein